MKKLFSLFATFFKIGLFTFGGGYAMLSLIQSETVTRKQWLGGDELLDIIAVAESTPGPISINCATYIGYKRAGVLGSIFATLGVVLPSFIIIFIISFFIEEFLRIEIINNAFKGIQAAVAVLIIRAGFKMIKNIKKDVMSIVILTLALAITVTINFISFNFSSIWLIVIGGAAGFVYYGLIKKDKSTQNGATEIVGSKNENSAQEVENSSVTTEISNSSEQFDSDSSEQDKPEATEVSQNENPNGEGEDKR